MPILIDLTKQIPPATQIVLLKYIASASPSFLAKKETYTLPSDRSSSFRLAHNLVIDSSSTDQIKRYLVISTDKLGEGTFSTARKIIGKIEIDLTLNSIVYQPIQDKAIRVTNTKRAEIQHHRRGTHYQHGTAVTAFEVSQPFSHLGMQIPVRRMPYSGRFGFLFGEKSYTVMNLFPGVDLDLAIDSFIRTRPDPKIFIDTVILPLLIAYKNQVASIGYVHRDIKPSNIKAALHTDGSSIFNFLDLDSCRKIGSADDFAGSPGFMATESWSKSYPVTPARDIFSLGVTLFSCINPSLDPNVYLINECGITNTPDALMYSLRELQRVGCYDPATMRKRDGTFYNVFSFINDSALATDFRQKYQNQIITLLKQMTALNPAHRPSLDTVIREFTLIQQELDAMYSVSVPVSTMRMSS